MSAPPTSFLNDFAVGFCQLLAAAGIGLSWFDTADYAADETGLWLGAAPLEVSRSVAVTPYPLSHQPTLPQSMIGIQFWSRSAGEDMRDVWALDDSINNALLGLFPITLPTDIRVSSLAYSTGGSMGMDDSNRWQWASSHVANVHRPSAHRS